MNDNRENILSHTQLQININLWFCVRKEMIVHIRDELETFLALQNEQRGKYIALNVLWETNNSFNEECQDKSS